MRFEPAKRRSASGSYFRGFEGRWRNYSETQYSDLTVRDRIALRAMLSVCPCVLNQRKGEALPVVILEDLRAGGGIIPRRSIQGPRRDSQPASSSLLRLAEHLVEIAAL